MFQSPQSLDQKQKMKQRYLIAIEVEETDKDKFNGCSGCLEAVFNDSWYGEDETVRPITVLAVAAIAEGVIMPIGSNGPAGH